MIDGAPHLLGARVEALDDEGRSLLFPKEGRQVTVQGVGFFSIANWSFFNKNSGGVACVIFNTLLKSSLELNCYDVTCSFRKEIKSRLSEVARE